MTQAIKLLRKLQKKLEKEQNKCLYENGYQRSECEGTVWETLERITSAIDDICEEVEEEEERGKVSEF